MIDFAELVGEHGAVTVVGGRTRWQAGGEVASGTREITAPSGVISYDPAEMTVAVKAGTTTAELASILADHGQRCALPERGGSVGGAIAVGEHHLEALGRGRLHTSVLAVAYVSAEGKVIRGGGPTVKNVSGFDLPRLIVGSLGTLGLVDEVTLRTNPSPSASEWFESGDADPFEVMNTVLRPSAILWNGATTRVLLEGHGVDVVEMQRQLATIGTWEAIDGPFELPPHRWSRTTRELRDEHGAFVASLGVGTVWRHDPQPPRTLEPGIVELSRRIKTQFDPTGRLNPGRSVY